MKNLVTSFLLAGILFLVTSGLYAQGHIDPPFLQIQSAEHSITVDGVADETDWQRRFDHLVFRSGFTPGDVEYGVTQHILVDGHPDYVDTTTTIVKILHRGTDLYFLIDSDDKYVNKWGGSWEGDGLFMKITDANGIDKEFKLYFNASGYDPDIVYEESQEGSGQGAGTKKEGTIVNDTTQIDAGYTAELVVHLAELGYTEEDLDVPLIINIFDPDKQTGTAGEEWNIGSYYKSWWGSEWGGVYRYLRLADPPLKKALTTDTDITLDGQLTEDFWTDADSIIVGKGSYQSSGGWYMQWGDTTNSYTDQSQAVVKFRHKGTDLYIGVQSNDSSVCKWSPGWEADGLFLWMTNKGDPSPANRMEIKNMYFDDTEGAGAVFELGGSAPTGSAEGASYEPEGTVTHTESNGPDAGYSLEVVVHTDYYGYSVGDTVKLSVVIWDLDYASADVYDEHVSDYAPNWWGTQWCDVNFEKYYLYRDVLLSTETAIAPQDNPVLANSYRLEQNYPNPFNPATTVSFYVPKRSKVSLEIYNILGKKIATLVNGEITAGNHTIVWNGKDSRGHSVVSGVYIYKLSTPESTQARKMMLLK